LGGLSNLVHMLKYRALTISLAFAAVGHFSPAAAQPAPAQNEVEDGFAFVTFVQSISAQKAALTCERGISGYREQFDSLFARWSEKHRDRIARGEAIYREILANPRSHTDRARLERIQNAIPEIERQPRNREPMKLDVQTEVACGENLSELETGIKYPPFGRRHE